MMKKVRILMLLLTMVGLLVGLTACNGAKREARKNQENLVGVWYLSEIRNLSKESGRILWEDSYYPDEATVIYTFYKDGTGKLQQNGYTVAIEYEVTPGSDLLIYGSDYGITKKESEDYGKETKRKYNFLNNQFECNLEVQDSSETYGEPYIFEATYTRATSVNEDDW